MTIMNLGQCFPMHIKCGILCDLQILIAYVKGVRSCTEHPITNHLTYAKLFAMYRVFITKIDNVEIPRDIQSALQDPHWKATVLEEINALIMIYRRLLNFP